MKRIANSAVACVLLWITVANINAQDAQKPWHLIAFENQQEVAFYNIEAIKSMDVTEQGVRIVLDNEKEFIHPVVTTTFSFDPRQDGLGTPNEYITAMQWRVSYDKGRLYFSEKVNGVAVFSVNGLLLAQYTGNYSEIPIHLQAGIYVIRADEHSVKLFVGNDNGNGKALAQPEKRTVYDQAPVSLHSDYAIKAYWNIQAGSATKSLKIPDVENFYFAFDNSVIYKLKSGNKLKLENYQRADFSVAPVNDTSPAEPIELTVRQDEKMKADNRFAFKMFKEVSAMKGANTFFSPLSLNLALGMLYNGASGDTRSEMAEVLGLTDFTDAEINAYYQKMSQALLNVDPLTEIGIANSIWYRTDFPVKQSYIDINQQYFDAVVNALDFNKPDAADIINAWCAGKTNDKITEIVESPISDDVMMYLINALYFKSNWLFEFDKAKTILEDFTTGDKKTVTVNMMEQRMNTNYYFDQHMQCVEMPYGNEAYSMVLLLPGNEMDIDQLIAYLDETSWQAIVNSLWEANVEIKMPRFKIECEIPLNDPVKNTGMTKIFQGGFQNISDVGIKVSNIQQNTFVEVNEAGTEAAAVTVIELNRTDTHDGPFSFYANRPFLYLIKEKSTGAILFIGRMDDPKE